MEKKNYVHTLSNCLLSTYFLIFLSNFRTVRNKSKHLTSQIVGLLFRRFQDILTSGYQLWGYETAAFFFYNILIPAFNGNILQFAIF